MAIIVNGDGILTGVSSLATDLTDITSGRGTVTGVATVGTLQLGTGVSMSSPRSQNAAIFTNNTEFLTVDDAGRVGVGTISPNTDAHPENVGKINVGFKTARSIAGDIDANTMVVAGISTFVGQVNSTANINVNGGKIILYGDGDALFQGAAANMNWDRSDNALEFQDDAKAVFGASSDLKIYHDSGSGQSLIEESGPSVLKLKASDFRISNTANSADYLQANDGSYLRLYHNGTIRLETTTTGVDVTSLNVTGISTFLADVRIDSDSHKLKLGLGADLNIYHNGSHSFIDNDTGTLYLQTATNLSFMTNNNEDAISCIANGSVNLYYDNVKKIETTSNGATISGQAQIDGNCFPYSDNNSDLGLSVNRWQDLYLSGNIYLGGTGSANALDDYEEGTWTPVIQGTGSNNSKNYTNQIASYTKIGNMVSLSFRVGWDSRTSDTGDAIVSGFPFTVNDAANATGSLAGNNLNFNNLSDCITAAMEFSNNQQYAFILMTQDSGTWVNPSANPFWQSTGEIRGSITYRTDS